MPITQNGVLKRDDNDSPVMGGTSSVDNATIINAAFDPVTRRLLTDSAAGAGTVTSVSVVSANGFAGTVANATTTPAITLTTTVTGILSGNGTAISAASTTGSGAVVLADTPTLITPVLGVATATSINKVTITAPATGSTLTIANGKTLTANVSMTLQGGDSSVLSIAASKTLTVSNILTFTGTDSSSVNFGAGGTVLYSGSTIPLTVGSTTIASGTTTRILYDNAGILGEYTIAGSGTIVAMATAPTFVTSIATPTVLATANDSGALGASGTAFSDLFLASGGVINWAAADATITHSSGLLTTNVPVTITGVATASGFAPTANTATGNRLYLPAANTLGFAINGSGEVQIDATATSPITNDGNALGTASLSWADLFLASGALINFANSNAVITHSSGVIKVTTGDLQVTSANVGTNGDSVPTLSSTSTLTNKTLTSPTLTTPSAFTTGGTITLAENTSIALDPAGSADGKYTGITVTGTSDYTQAFGDLVYLKASNSRWAAADADAATTAGPVALAMVVVAGTSGNACTLLLQGIIRADAKFPTMTVGATQYVGETAGEIQGAIPTGADNVIRTVGYALTADELYFNPSTDWQITVA